MLLDAGNATAGTRAACMALFWCVWAGVSLELESAHNE
jgi:hypothetical protein